MVFKNLTVSRETFYARQGENNLRVDGAAIELPASSFILVEHYIPYNNHPDKS